MSEELHPKYEVVLACFMQRLHGHAQRLGLGEGTVRQIVERVIADMPDADDFDRMTEARARMVQASVGAE
ncbi:hypothetical protein [Methylobacterium sp. CM6257]|jgi:hypothetical protein